MIIKRRSLQVYAMIGLPGSGKSTWIKNNLAKDIPVISRDKIREELGYLKPGEKAVLDFQTETKIAQIEKKQAEDYIKAGKSFVIDDTNISSFAMNFLSDLKKKHDIELIGIRMKTPLMKCKERRKDQIPSDVMDRLEGNLKNIDLSIFDKVYDSL